MSFRSRNAYYLRISASSVLPLYVYLDERHIDWMSDRVLQHVLSDLRPLIVPKLKAEADARLEPGGPSSAKRGTVDVQRGDSYQFAFFFRKTEPHSVLIKTRTFIAAPSKEKQVDVVSESPTKQGKRKGRRKNNRSEFVDGRKKRKTKGKGKAVVDVSDEDVEASSGESNDGDLEIQDIVNTPRRSGRGRKVVAGGYREADDEDSSVDGDVEMTGPFDATAHAVNRASESQVEAGLEQIRDPNAIIKDEAEEVPLDTQPLDRDDLQPDADSTVLLPEPTSSVADLELEIEEQELKPKPMLRLKYQGFNIYGRCLCVVVEPWPPIRASSRATSVTPFGLAGTRAPSIAPPDFIPSGEAMRARTPLFLPDPDRGRSETPGPCPQQRVLPPVPLFNDPRFAEDDDAQDDYGDTGLMEFSQALNSAGDHRAGAADDDDEMDGAVFFGDADEAREL